MKIYIRSGFTLVELLAVIAIIGILLSFLIPAVQQVREKARATHCKNNLRQIGIAMLHYEASNGRLPPGTLGFSNQIDYEPWDEDPNSKNYWKRSQYTSYLVFILPFMEQTQNSVKFPAIATDMYHFLDDFENPDSETPYYSSFLDYENIVDITTTRMPEFECPSVDVSGMPTIATHCAPQPVWHLPNGFDEFTDAMGSRQLEQILGKGFNYTRTDYLGCAGAHCGGYSPDPERRPFVGIMSTRYGTKMSQIADGTSRTIMAGETMGWIHDSRKFAVYSWAFSGIARGRGGLPWMKAFHPDRPMLGDERESFPFSFGSPHNGQVNFVFGDGAVDSINPAIRWDVFYALSGINDGGIYAGD